jgi:thiaminase/transcriptional activator TenA
VGVDEATEAELDLVDTSGGTVDTSMDSFTAALGEDCSGLFEAFWQHPAVAGLRDGSLPAECVRAYVGQDYQYLTAFMRCYGLGIALSPDRDWVSWFHDQVAFLLADETHPHRVLCQAIGERYEDVQQRQLAPTAQGYVDHMLAAGHDTLGILLAALLPCAWTYIWAATRYVDETPPAEDHPFGGWWWFYASPDSQQLLQQFRARTDTLAAEAGAAERRRMADAFTLSCRYEVRFWQMAWTLEGWSTAEAADPGLLGTR